MKNAIATSIVILSIGFSASLLLDAPRTQAAPAIASGDSAAEIYQYKSFSVPAASLPTGTSLLPSEQNPSCLIEFVADQPIALFNLLGVNTGSSLFGTRVFIDGDLKYRDFNAFEVPFRDRKTPFYVETGQTLRIEFSTAPSEPLSPLAHINLEFAFLGL